MYFSGCNPVGALGFRMYGGAPRTPRKGHPTRSRGKGEKGGQKDLDDQKGSQKDRNAKKGAKKIFQI